LKHLPPRSYLPVVSFRVGVTCAVLTACLLGCGDQVIDAVGIAQACTQEDGGTPQECDPAPDPARSVGFESPPKPGILADTDYPPVSILVVSCMHSHCGTASLAVGVNLSWTSPAPDTKDRQASFEYFFDSPVDLLGHTVGFWILAEGPALGQQAQIGVLVQTQPEQPLWHGLGVKTLGPGWNQISGLVSNGNSLADLNLTASSIYVTALKLDFFVPPTDASGDHGRWSGILYIDDLAW